MLGAAGKEGSEVGGIGSAERVSQAFMGWAGLGWREVEFGFQKKRRYLLARKQGASGIK